jgi:site-specific DNA-methyltransferase (adenine-specific)
MKPYYFHAGITIYHGDALFVLPELSNLGAVVTDPPYSSGGAFRSDRTRATVDKYVQTRTAAYRPDFAGDSRDQRAFLSWCALWMSAARAAAVVGAPLISFTDWRQLPVLTDALQAGGWTWRGIATWWKPGIRMQRGSFSHSAEYLVHGTNGPAERDYDGAQQNVFKCAVVADREHIAEKPLSVMQWILSVVEPQAVVLDPFAGSGSTLVAAKALNRPAVGIEVDERYCEIAAKRLETPAWFCMACGHETCVRRGANAPKCANCGKVGKA